MTRIIIAEKPDMGRKIASALKGPHRNGQGYIETGEGIVTWCIGHIMEALQPSDYNPIWEKWSFDNLPILIDEWKIKVDSKKSSQFSVIKNLLAKSTEVVNAGDPGREGQLIVDEVLHYLKYKKPVKRVLLFSLDKKSIIESFANLQDNRNFHNLYLAGVCRGVADFLTGINGTRAFTLLAQANGYKGVLSVGRVQSPTLAIVVKRDEEIENFKSHDYFTITATFDHNGTSFKSYWKPNEKTPLDWIDNESRLINQNAANQINQKVKGKQGIVTDYEENEGKEQSPLPFNLSKMQIYASAKWGMGAKEVLDVCQSLYEKHELQSYPRTDCQYLPENQFSEAPTILAHIKNSHSNLVNAVNGAKPSLKGQAWNDQKLGEHYGLIPTKKQADLSLLSPNEKKIYGAVCERYIAQFYPACEFKTAKISVLCESEIFQANGKIILNPGWRAIFNNEEETEEKSNNDEVEQVFPNISSNQKVLCKDSQKQDKKTTPPSRFTEGTLIKAMTSVHTLVSDPEQKKKLKEKKGIGQEATRTQIIENLFKRELFVKQGKQIISTSAGRSLIHALPKKLIAPELTAVWEDALDKIAEGKITPENFMEKQKQWVIQIVNDAKTTKLGAITNTTANSFSKTSSASKTASKPAKVGKICPICKTGHMVERKAGTTGNKFFGCSAYPKCKHSEWPKK